MSEDRDATAQEMGELEMELLRVKARKVTLDCEILEGKRIPRSRALTTAVRDKAQEAFVRHGDGQHHDAALERLVKYVRRIWREA